MSLEMASPGSKYNPCFLSFTLPKKVNCKCSYKGIGPRPVIGFIRTLMEDSGGLTERLGDLAKDLHDFLIPGMLLSYFKHEWDTNGVCLFV